MLIKGNYSRKDPTVWWVVAFIALFTLGGITGLVLSCATVDMFLHDSWFVIAHFHYVLSLGSYIRVVLSVVWW